MARELSTLADLAGYVHERWSKPVLLRQCGRSGSQSLSPAEFYARVQRLSLGLTALGVKEGDRVAIVSESRVEWLLADLAILMAGAITVPVYSTLSGHQTQYILADSGARIAFVSTEVQAAKVQEVRHRLPALQAMVRMVEGGVLSWPSVVSFEQVVERGRQLQETDPAAETGLQARIAAVRPAGLATIIYTSGTSGEPKGVMLSHTNIVSNILGSVQVLPPFTQDDLALTFLPLSHAFERLVVYLYLHQGVTVAFAESIDTLGRDMAAERPTVMTGVPRVYEKLQARILENVSKQSPGKQRVFRWALRVGLARAQATLKGAWVPPQVAAQYFLADRLVFATIRQRLGGRLQYFVSGSAPLSRATAEFFFAIGVPIYEGYGLTETSPVLTVNPPDVPRAGTVGKAIPGVELRIGNDGEILARGPNIMLGYYNKPAETAEALRDGWFHTGDIGQLDAKGYLSITDRKKELIVTAGGKKIAPAPIESLLRANPLVAEAVIIGDRRRFPAVLIVPDFTTLETRLRELGRPSAAHDALVEREDVRGLYEELIDAVNRDLAHFEQIKKVALLPTEFSIAGGELTPTMKVKRRVVEEKWKLVVDKLYESDDQ